MKILFIRFSSIGDIVLTTPAIRCTKNQLPEAELHFVCKKSFQQVMEHNPYISKFFYLDNNLPQLIQLLKQEKYDYVIDLHKNYRSVRIAKALHTTVSTYRKLSWQKFLLTKTGIDWMPQIHISQRCLNAVAPLGVKDDGKGLDYFIAPSDRVATSDLPFSHLHGFVAVVIGASFFTKKLPVEKLQELCTKIPYPIILIGGKEDALEGDAIAQIDSIKIYNACGKFSLNESADLIRQSKVVVSHDTGMQYIACAYQKNVVAIWGGTSPKLAVEPYYGSSVPINSKHTNFIVPNLKCQPCSNFGTATCPKKHFRCMQLQPIDTIAQQVITYYTTNGNL